jgi:predicted transglutaminase-like cysteine proteinase
MFSKSVVTAILLALALAPASAQAESIFKDRQGGADLTQFPFWERALADAAAAQPPRIAEAPVSTAQAESQRCADDRLCTPEAWTTFLDSLRGQPAREQMDAVNRWANAQPYVEDQVNWGVADYWETPAEFLARGGDCEDYAIFKYASLARLGFSPDDLRIVVVNDTALNAFHAVLAVRLAGKTWLLDNQTARTEAFGQAPQYTPIYSLNGHGWWMHSAPVLRAGTVTIVAAGSPRTTSSARGAAR